jgi:hypothetical protein
MLSRLVLALTLVASPCLTSPSLAAGILDNRPAFSEANEPAKRPATCEELRRMSAGLNSPDLRIDLAIVGQLTAIRPNGAFWSMEMCRDLYVMCLAYQSSDLKVGDRVLFRGAYSRLDENHVVLGPCLADRQ